MPAPFPVAILGFNPDDRKLLGELLQRTARRTPAYKTVLGVDDARFVIADAAQPEVVALLRTLGRTADAVFVGGPAPAGAAAQLTGPVDPSRLLHQLDSLLARRDGSPLASAPPSRATAVLSHPPSPWHQDRDDARRKRAALQLQQPRPRVLLVDDSEIALHYLRRQLQRYRLEVDTARTGERALQLLAQHSYGLVFMDLDLGPDSLVDGFDLCHQICHGLQHPGGKPPAVVMVSAFHGPVDQVRGTLSGAVAYLGKPLDCALLDTLLQRQGLALPSSMAVPATPADPADPADPAGQAEPAAWPGQSR